MTTVILIGAGALIGLFWEEWKVVRLAFPAGSGAVPGTVRVDTSTDSGATEGSTGTSSAAEELPGRVDPANRIKIEVLNGAGERGLARRFADRLRALGFDVVATGNAEHFDHGVTHVVDRSGRRGAAVEVARELSTDSLAIALDPDLFLDVSVVVGSDWTGLLGNIGRD